MLEEGYIEKQIYHIKLKSYVFTSNPNSQCGLARTFEITIKTDDRLLVDHVRFWEKCSNEHYIDSFIFLPHEGTMQFLGNHDDPEGSRFNKSF